MDGRVLLFLQLINKDIPFDKAVIESKVNDLSAKEILYSIYLNKKEK